MKLNKLFFAGLATSLLGVSAFSSKSFAQIGVVPKDTTVCPGVTYTIHGTYSTSNAPNNQDDYFSSTIVDLGFPFVFYGNTYTQCVVSSNNFICFNTSGRVGGYSSYTWTGALSAGDLDNSIFFPFQDTYFVTGGRINYQTFGTAPHRKFVIEFCKVPLFSCTSTLVTDQLILYEGTNVIEMHLKDKPVCTAWLNGSAVEGIRYNNNQALVPGRDVPNVPWTATNDARRFTPAGNNNYTIDTIPFDPVNILTTVDSNQIVWYEEGNPVPIHTGPSVNVTIQPGINYYVAKVSGLACNDNTPQVYTDTSFVHFGTSFDTLDINICQGESYNFVGREINQAGTYDTLIGNTGGCDSLIRLYLHVNPLPDATLSDTTFGQLFCNGGQAQLAIAHPAPNYTYQWYRDGQPAPGGTNPDFGTSNEGNYQLVVTTNMGCVDSSALISMSKNTVDIDFDAVPLYGCGQDTIQIVNHSDSLNSVYSWNFGDGSYPPDSTRSPMHIYQQQGNYVIQLKMTNGFGCSDSLSKIIAISHPLQAAFSADFDSLCQTTDAHVQFTNNSVGASNYVWSFDDGSGLSTAINPTHDFTLAGAHNVRLVAYNDIPCFDTAYHIIYVDSTPSIHISSDKRDLCVGEPVTFGADYLNTAKKINWDFADGVDWIGSDSITHRYDEPGNYIVTVTANFPVCPDQSDTFKVHVHALPLVNLGPDSVMCLEGDPITLQNLATTDPSATYLWSTGETTPSIRVGHPGTYSLTVSAFDCITTESVTIEKDCYLDIPNAFTPNGDGENDYFMPRQLLQKGATSFQMVIYNRWGQKMFQTTNLNGRGWDGRFNGKDQPNGVYIYQLQVSFKNGQVENYSGNITLIR